MQSAAMSDNAHIHHKAHPSQDMQYQSLNQAHNYQTLTYHIFLHIRINLLQTASHSLHLPTESDYHNSSKLPMILYILQFLFRMHFDTLLHWYKSVLTHDPPKSNEHCWIPAKKCLHCHDKIKHLIRYFPMFYPSGYTLLPDPYHFLWHMIQYFDNFPADKVHLKHVLYMPRHRKYRIRR